MVVVRSHETSSSTPYHVFLSFRGEDTRYTFTDHLYKALVQHGFRTFRDDDEMQKGEYLKSELEKAISQSKSSIVVISENYASSTWCLDELVMILGQRTSGHVVLPVFYHVDPSEVRKQTGRTADAFAKYEKQCEEKMDSEGKRKWMEKIQGWRSALTEVADLIGHHHVDGHESKFIQEIIKDIGVNVSCTPLHVDPYIIGIDSQTEKINMWLEDGSNDDRVRAICGMGGIGKTTIAKIVYNQNLNSFDGSSFVANIREVLKHHNGPLRLQRQLLSDISRREHGKIRNGDVGLAKIKNLIFSKRVLLVLDDVEELGPLYDTLGRPDWLFRGSKVIITTRHERMLQPHQMFRVRELDQDESIKLFSFNAFREDFPPESYTEHTKRAVQICEGLPLALKIVGSSLSGKREDEWVHELTKMESIPQGQIQKRLKISYDSLKVHEKSIFLDIACFFVGINKDYTIKILEKRDLHVDIIIQDLIDRCLLTSDHGIVLTMHRLIQDMGREITREESCEAGERSRLWHHRDAFGVLESETGTKVVEGLTLDMRTLKEVGNHGKKLIYEESHDKSIFSTHASSFKQRFSSFIYGQSISTTITSPNDVNLRTDAFKRMRKLRLLKLNYIQLVGSYENFPKTLVWLSWHGFPLKSIPVEFPLKNLVALDLSHSRLQQVWMETPFLGSLKILNLSYSEWLARTPNFLYLPQLERLILKGCVRLIEVCESIGNLEMLDLLDLQDCKTLRKLPKNIGKLGSLKTLIISGCNIGELPSEMGNMNSLEVLKADEVVINPLQSSSGDIKWWQPIVWSRVPTLRKGLGTLWASLPCSLRYLSLSGCNLCDDSFPVNFGDLPLLTRLNLSNNPFRRLPNCIRSLSGLTDLNVNGCHALQLLDLNGVSINLGCIRVHNCTSLEKVKPIDKSNCIFLRGSEKLIEVKDIFKNIPTTRFTFNMGLVEFGIFTMLFSGLEFPTFTGEKCEGSSICFTVPRLPAYTRAQCLYVWCLYEITREGHCFDAWISVIIKNRTKDLTWIYAPRVIPCSIKVGWLSKWRFGNQLEAGDEITITFDGDDKYCTKEVGFKFGYHCDQDKEKQENESSSSSSSTMEEENVHSHHDFPDLRSSTGEYFLNCMPEGRRNDYVLRFRERYYL